MKHYWVNYSIFIVSLLLLISSCTKREEISPVSKGTETYPTRDQVIDEVKDYYKSRRSTQHNRIARKENTGQHILWEKAKAVTADSSGRWLVVVPVIDFEKPTHQTQLVFFAGSKNAIKAMAIEKIPDPSTEEKDIASAFTGKINILDMDFNLSKENIFTDGQLINSPHSQPNAKTSSDPDCGDDTTCLPQVVVFAERIDDEGEAEYSLVVPYSYYSDWDYSNTGSEHGSWNEEYNGWNVDVPSGGNMTEANQVVAPPDKPILDVAKYLSCFSNDPGSSYKVTVHVDQPVPGERTHATIKERAGHAFLTLEQTTGSQTIRRSIGFYPKDGANFLMPISTGIFNDDSDQAYDISLLINLDPDAFHKLLNSLNNYPVREYNLDTNNCTDMCLTTLKNIGIILPDTFGDWFNGGGTNPADLGEDLRTMPLKSGMSRNTAAGRSEANAGCD